jgi:hypothetical protein
MASRSIGLLVLGVYPSAFGVGYPFLPSFSALLSRSSLVHTPLGEDSFTGIYGRNVDNPLFHRVFFLESLMQFKAY